jgi:hypothetical protein
LDGTGQIPPGRLSEPFGRLEGKHFLTRSRLKNRILVQDCGGAEFKTAGILLYVEDLKRGTNKDIGPKNIFEMAST